MRAFSLAFGHAGEQISKGRDDLPVSRSELDVQPVAHGLVGAFNDFSRRRCNPARMEPQSRDFLGVAATID